MTAHPTPWQDPQWSPEATATLPAIEGIAPAQLLQLLRGDVTRCRRLLQTFADHHAADMAALRTAQGEEAARLLHQLKGSAAAVGADGVGQAAGRIEQRLRQGEAAAALGPELSRLADTLQHLLTQIRLQLPPGPGSLVAAVASSALSLPTKPEFPMLEFDIASLSCGHCVRAVTEAVHEVDPAAQVDVDLAGKHVQVQTSAARDRVVAALVEAGYAPAATEGP